MGNAMLQWLLNQTPRERLLLALLALIVPPVLAVYVMLLPLHDKRMLARQNLTESRNLEQWVAEQARTYQKTAQRPDPGTSATAPIGISGIEASLQSAGLRDEVQELSNSSRGDIFLSFETVRFTALTKWLGGVMPGWGYEISSFSFERGDGPDRVSATFNLGVPQ
ncbi:MAG: hypothetical protein CSA68_06220 [Rhodobacterales bacterium]|nr:MAG: hypothetical protein CSA68_06220 [Rhodobacterales bacterium]